MVCKTRIIKECIPKMQKKYYSIRDSQALDNDPSFREIVDNFFKLIGDSFKDDGDCLSPLSYPTDYRDVAIHFYANREEIRNYLRGEGLLKECDEVFTIIADKLFTSSNNQISDQ